MREHRARFSPVLASPPASALLTHLHHTVRSSDGGPSPHPPSGGDLTEQLGQFALHLSLKHFILELLLNDTQEDYMSNETHRPPNELAVEKRVHTREADIGLLRNANP